MAKRSAPGTIVVVRTTPAAIHRGSNIHGEFSLAFNVRLNAYSTGFCFLCTRCFVGDGSDQWRKCSDKYYPTSSTAPTTGPSASASSITISSAGDHQQQVSEPISITISTRRPDNDIDDDDNIHQRPPRPGGLGREDRAGVARLWPITYLYTTGPPNSTDLSNFVDCNKEHC